jgi:hypothetical protein
MTSFRAFILVTNSYLLILWLLPHNQINMTFYYVDVCIQTLKRFELTQAYSLSTYGGMHSNNIIM